MKRNLSILLAVLFSVVLFSDDQAGERTRSNKYQGKHSSGTFQSSSALSGGQKTTNQSLTHQDGKTWQRQIETAKEGETINRTVTTTNPEGKTNTFTQSVTLD